MVPECGMKMSMAVASIRYYTDRERIAYQKISGMEKVLSAKPAERNVVNAQYPDAVFAIMIHDEMVCGISEVRDIAQKAHSAILSGEKIGNIRYCYSREMDKYFSDHTWDD